MLPQHSLAEESGVANAFDPAKLPPASMDIPGNMTLIHEPFQILDSTQLQQGVAANPYQGMEISEPKSAVVSNDGTSASQQSNAFEGTLDPVDFAKQQLGIDPMSWLPAEWLATENLAADMAV